jgi:hypothetical protein
MAAQYKVYVDWAANGTFADGGDDVTARVLDGRTPVSMQYGRDQSRALSPGQPGQARFELDNRSRDYSPENASSSLAGKVLPGREVRIDAINGGTTTSLYRGNLDDFTLKPDLTERSIDVSCLDGLGRLRGTTISTSMYQGLRTGEAVHKLLDAAGWPTTLRDIDQGATVMPYWWIDSADAYEALQQLVDSEGPYAIATCNGSGQLVFRDRHHRIQRTRSVTSQSTWRTKGAEPLVGSPASYDHGWKDIINSVSWDVPLRAPAPEPSVLWTAQSRITIAAGETAAIVAKGSSPFVQAFVPQVGTDYTTVDLVSVSMPKTSGESTTIYLTASTGAPATVDGLQVRGYALTTVATAVVGDQDSSVSRYGVRTSTALRQPVWAGMYDTQAIVALTLAQRAERLPTISVSMVSANAARLAQQLGRDLSDRVHVVEPETGLDADCWVEQIQHSIGQGGLEHRTTFGLEKAPAQTTGALVLGSATLGLLGAGKLARRGFADPASILTLSSATLGVLGAQILAA